MKPQRRFRALTITVTLLATGATQVGAQTPARGSGLQGFVVDARTGLPLEGATVTLEPLPSGIVVQQGPGSAGLLATARQSLTLVDGAYAFQGLSPGTYRVRVSRIGYHPALLEVHYDGPADPRVSIGLQVAPVELEPLDVVTRRPELLRTSRGAAPLGSEDERIRAERLRQQRYLTPDTRVLTEADVLEAATIGETDLLRALQHLPGVVAEDDWSAEPWTRGARWDETRIYFDGLPLLDPMHLGGAAASIDPDAVGSLTFHPGVHPVDAGDASAAVVDLRSRRATGEDGLTALGQLSILSARFSLDRPYGQGNGVTVSGRRSLLEAIAGSSAERGPGGPGSGGSYPFRFSDVAGRWDQVLGDSLRLEVSGLRTRDRVLGDLPYELKGARGSWGNRALRATLEGTWLGMRTRLTRGASTFASEIELAPFDPERPDLEEAKTAAPMTNRVRTDVTEISVAPVTPGGEPAPWSVGARRIDTRVEYAGPAPWPYPDAANAGTLEQVSNVARYASWGQLRRRVAPDMEVSLGARLESWAGAGGDDLTAAPRVALAWTPRPELRVSAALGRHHQYEQALAAAGFSIGSGLVPGHLWVSSRGAIPTIRADMATVGAELWLPGGWLASANAYVRDAAGRLTPDPDSGYVRARPPVVESELGAGWVTSADRTVGLEVGVRRLTGRWTGSMAYSLSRGRTRAVGYRYPTPGERAHALDAAVVLQAFAKTRVGATLTAASGAAYTRFYAFRCDEVSWYCPTADAGDARPIIGWVEPAGMERTAPYMSLDLHVEHTGTVMGFPVGVYAQLRNALARDNRAAYVGSILECDVDGRSCTLTDHFEDGFPLLPLVGLWIRM